MHTKYVHINYFIEKIKKINWQQGSLHVTLTDCAARSLVKVKVDPGNEFEVTEF